MKKLFAKLTLKLDDGLSRVIPRFLQAPNFVILGSPRSGSNLLVELLNFHPQICCHAELYSPSGVYSFRRHFFLNWETKWFVWLRDRFPLSFLKWIWFKPRNRNQTVGFKVFDFQSPKILSTVLTQSTTKKIILYRKNFLRAELSNQIATKTDEWELKNGVASNKRVTFDLHLFRKRFKRVRKFERDWENYLLESDQKFIKISYESISGPDRSTELNVVFDFLGLSRTDVCSFETKLKKQNPYSIRELVTNFEEIEAALTGTECEWMLNEN